MPLQVAILLSAKLQYLRKGQAGFTLVELLVVITLLGLLSLTAMALVDNVDEQDRYEATRARWQQLRPAIVGDVSRTLNGEPVLTGYAADMGRLPKNLKELVEIGSQPAWAAVTINGSDVYGGWRGPYLSATPESGDTRTYRDGWANPLTPADDYGWKVTLTGTAPNHTAIAVQSVGSDAAVGGTAYAEDYPASGNAVNANDWLLGNAAVNFNIIFNAPSTDTTTENLILKVYFFKDNDTADAAANSIITKDASPAFTLTSTDVVPYTQTVTVSAFNPAMGRYAAVVWCSVSNNIYNGKCDGSGTTHAPYYFTLLPNTLLPLTITIPWRIS